LVDWKKALGTSILSAGMVFSAFAPAIAQDKAPASSNPSFALGSGAPFDLGIANDDRLIEMLKKSGKIAQDASPAEADKVLQAYLHERAEAALKTKSQDTFAQQLGSIKKDVRSKMDQSLKSGKGSKLGQAKQNDVAGVQKEAWDGSTRQDEVLVLLIDYPDLPHGHLTKDETDMYYSGDDAYSLQHYKDMIFGENGYVGPDGKTKISMKQFYEAQSGGSYTVDGEVAGWYTAKHPAAYYGNNTNGNARALIKEALNQAAQDPSVDLGKFDKEDPFDLDGDGNTREPDGIIDHLMVIHSGVGEEAGGGSIGDDAIWSHSSNLGGLYPIANTSTDVPYWGGQLVGYAYTVQPEDGAAGVFAHEFGHNLGLPDEYDTLYSGSGEPISYWSIMSSGSWTGAIPGTEPSGFSPYDKEYLQASMTTPDFTPNWQTGTEVNFNDLTSQGTELLLDEAATKGTNNDVVKVQLPDKENILNTPKDGGYEYYGGKGDEIDHSMVKNIDLTGATNATLDFDAWYDIESNWDFAFVQVSTDNGATWHSLSTDQTTDVIDKDGYPDIQANLPGYTGNSNGWIHQTVDLSQYAGQNILLQFRYMTDWGTNLGGFAVDNVNVTANGTTVLNDGAEGTPSFNLDGFTQYNGKSYTNQYYLLEWRTQNGSDSGLAHVNRKGTMLSYDKGLLVWYVDDAYDNNWTGPGFHPGDGFLGVVDADQHNNIWHYKDWNSPDGYFDVNKLLGSNSYQMHDAAFSLDKGTDVTIGDKSFYLKDNHTINNALFDDSQNYLNPQDPDVGRNIPHLGLKVRVVGESADGTVGKILLYR
jgi:immune inhibitor A